MEWKPSPKKMASPQNQKKNQRKGVGKLGYGENGDNLENWKNATGEGGMEWNLAKIHGKKTVRAGVGKWEMWKMGEMREHKT